MALLTPDQFREHVETTLGDDAIQRLLDANEAEITRRFGPIGTHTEVLIGDGPYLFPGRAVATITLATETRYDVDTILSDDDYLIHDGGLSIERVTGGDNPGSRWGNKVAIEATTVDDTAARVGVLLALTEIDIRAKGVQSIRIGEWQETYSGGEGRTPEDEREAILGRLGRRFAIY
jgi:hypothetical protein